MAMGKTAVTSQAIGARVHHSFVSKKKKKRHTTDKSFGYVLHQILSSFTVGFRRGTWAVQNIGEESVWWD